MAAFAFARLRFRGRESLFLLYLATLMIPFQVTMIPNFILVRYLGWFDSFQALIFPTAFSAFLRQYFHGRTLELDDRAHGQRRFRFPASVADHQPALSSPVLAALTIFTLLGSWNLGGVFLWPLIVTNSVSTCTVPVSWPRSRANTWTCS
ncbi:MAG: hypothetical protein R2856_03300 [Caldilineaceae bacterium]